MAEENIFTMDLGKLIEQETKVWNRFYNGLDYPNIKFFEGDVDLCPRECVEEFFKAGCYEFATPENGFWVPCTKRDVFYKICEYELTNGAPYPGSESSVKFDVKNSYGEKLNKFKSYFTGDNYDASGNKTPNKNNLLIDNIKKTVQYFNLYLNSVVSKYSITPGVFFISSALRTPVNNMRAGGVPSSQHLTGMAVDVRFMGMTSNLILRFLNDTYSLGVNGSLLKNGNPEMIAISGGALNSKTVPTQIGVYYEPWFYDEISFSDLTYNNNFTRQVIEQKGLLSYDIPQLDPLIKINKLQNMCIKANTINPVHWFHVAFIGNQYVYPDPGVTDISTFGPARHNVYVTRYKKTKSKVNYLSNISTPMSADLFDRTIYFDNISGIK